MGPTSGTTPVSPLASDAATVEAPKIETLEASSTELAPLSRVVCHDDPHTTMEFVIEVLRGVFRLPQARAVELMMRVHQSGAAVIGRYPHEVAERKVTRATSLARANAYPLTFSVEEGE
jgi:ATP-dependent Clp protease adaptor protein ClpS